MRRSSPLLFRHSKSRCDNLIQINNGTFYLQHPAVGSEDSTTSNPALFRDLTFELPATSQEDGRARRKAPHWAVVSKGGATKFLEILRGSHICIPPGARTFPYLSSAEIERKDHRLRIPSRAIQYVGFNGGKGAVDSGIRGAYLSARYESRREETDWSLMQYLKGETDLNPAEEKEGKDTNSALLKRVIKDLRLEKLVDMPVSNLSNGQTRRSRIARALLGKPELLLLDEPFMGLDPPTLVSLSPILRDLAYRSSPLLLLALRPQDPIPDWITHLAVLGSNSTIALMGEKPQVLFSLHRWVDMYNSKSVQLTATKMAEKMTEAYGPPLLEVGHSLTSKGVVRYTAYEKAKEIYKPRYFNVHGDVYGKLLSGDKRERYYTLREQLTDEMALDDLVFLTSVIPDDFEERTNARQKSTTTLATIDSQASTDTMSASGKRALGEPLIELHSVVVKYGDKTVLGYPPPQPGFQEPGLNLTIYRGTRLALLGPNGSGKTTLLSLLTSDHPHSYSLPIKFFGRSRLPQAGQLGLSLWEIQARIGHSSPEVHGFFPRDLTIRKVLESAWAETYGAKPKLTWERDEMVDAFLRWWEPELRQIWPRGRPDANMEAENLSRRAWIDSLPEDLDPEERRKILRKSREPPNHTKSELWKMMQQSYPPIIPTSESEFPDLAHSRGWLVGWQPPETDTALDWAEDVRNHTFGLLPFGTQRLLLLLRAMIKEPDILVLDEAFSGLSPESREKAMCWLEHGENMYLQGQAIVQKDQSELADAKNNGDATGEDPGESSIPDEMIRTPKGRSPSKTVLAWRPPPQPGRAPGRPLGSPNKEGATGWMPKPKQEAIVHGEKRWQLVKVPNMRRTVERACAAFDVDMQLLARGRHRDLGYRVLHDLTRSELVEAADSGSGKGQKLSSKLSVGSDARSTRDQGMLEETGEREVEAQKTGYIFQGLSERQAMIVVSHVREEVPAVVDEWLRLPGEEEVLESSRSVEMGRCDGGSIRTVEGWGKVWGL